MELSPEDRLQAVEQFAEALVEALSDAGHTALLVDLADRLKGTAAHRLLDTAGFGPGGD